MAEPIFSVHQVRTIEPAFAQETYDATLELHRVWNIDCTGVSDISTDLDLSEFVENTEGWHRFTVLFQTTNSLVSDWQFVCDDIIEWCNNNLTGDWSYACGVFFAMADDNDAVHFKLRWC